jgi:hypothetical protein
MGLLVNRIQIEHVQIFIKFEYFYYFIVLILKFYGLKLGRYYIIVNNRLLILLWIFLMILVKYYNAKLSC